MMHKLVMSNLLFCCLCVTANGQEHETSNLQFDEVTPPAHFNEIEWEKSFDTSSVTDRQTRLRMLQYNALIPWHQELTRFVSLQRMDTLRLRTLQIKMARLRTQISNDPNEKKKGLETEIFLLKETEELYGFQLQAPARPRGPAPISIDVEQLGSVIVQRVEREEELAQLNLQLEQSNK